MNYRNLWPEEITQEVVLMGPAAILKEQGELLAQSTKNVVKAITYRETLVKEGEIEFNDRFVIDAPLINYRYSLFELSYPMEFYPTNIQCEYLPEPGYTTVEDEEALLKVIAKIFHHPKTVKIIQALILRSQNNGEAINIVSHK